MFRPFSVDRNAFETTALLALIAEANFHFRGPRLL